jgi:hypothetical protein
VMLAGEAVVAIWNGIAPEMRAEFYDWHQNEHMPERVGIPGFRRGRRYIAMDAATHPEFFTLYEVDALPVLQGSDYANRLNAPTPWTRKVTAQFRDTARGLARVLESVGPGAGGMILTLRFDADAAAADALRAAVRDTARSPRVTGAHLCVTDDAASGVRTTETKGRTGQCPVRCRAISGRGAGTVPARALPVGVSAHKDGVRVGISAVTERVAVTIQCRRAAQMRVQHL